MKKFIAGICFNFLFSFSNAQNGLEQIIVEKYYVSDANDSLASDGVSLNPGTLPVGSVTYRIYADMLPGYKFQAVYGVPGHEWRIETTTLFYNNEDRGATTPTYSKTQAKNNTVMLDSWLTVGAACAGNSGVLKTDDDGVATVVNADGVLQNNDPDAGIPLTVEDGMIAGTPEPVTLVGITNEVAMFDAQNDGTNGPLFSTSNGSLASLNGSVGPDSSTNIVLLAQITTNGVFSFELNIQIGTPVGGGVENYVARDPVGNEIVIPSLIYPNTTGIHEKPSSSSSFISLSPNPAADFVNLHLLSSKRGTANYTVYDVSGRRMMRHEMGMVSADHIERIDVSSLDRGIYFVEVSSPDGLCTKQLVRN